MKILLGAALIIFSTLTSARDLTPEQKMYDFTQLIGQVKSNYGPLEYKKQNLKIDVDTLKLKYSPLIQNSKNNAEFYDLMLRFVAEFRDSHFSIRIPSKKRASLPITSELVQDHVLVGPISGTLNGIEAGDEILKFDGIPAMDLVKDLALRRGDGYGHSTLRIAAMYLTARAGSQFALPSGNAVLEIKSYKTGKTQTVTLPWSVTGTDLDNKVNALEFSAAKPNSYDDLSMARQLKEDLGPNLDKSYMCSGGTRIEKPAGSVVIMETPFVAYYYTTAKGKVGYLRIPHYIPGTMGKEIPEDDAFANYEYAVSELEKNTVGLIIDQDHNCGGSVSYLHRLASLFTLKPIPVTPFRLVASKTNLLEMSNSLDNMDKNTISYLEGAKLFALMQTAWDANEYLTPKTSITLSTTIYPNPVRYTKPIVMLIDELSGSGGDAFPVLMQGTGRMKLLGTRTMGAGGHVVANPALSFSMMTSNMTRSLFFRPDGIEVENNGAVPDIPYVITTEDFVNHYIPYREFYTQTLLNLL